jgi:outer membrane assembly lipoprotein YfiO
VGQGHAVKSLSVPAALSLALVLPACGAHELDMQALASASDQVLWEAGQKAQKNKNWNAARQYYKRLVDAFPQSEHQPQARVALGDSYFEEGGTANLILAVSAYREFLTLYPQHPRSAYAQFRVGECYYEQRNRPDRDQTETHQALEEYERLLDVYPQSEYVEQARERIHECRQTLARSNYLVGYFYQRTRHAWRSAIGRYEAVLTDFPDYDRIDEVLFHISECLAASGRYAEALPYLARLQSEFPKSDYVDDARKLQESFPPASTPASAPATTPSAAPTPPTPPIAP